jgi:hypothetical protein
MLAGNWRINADEDDMRSFRWYISWNDVLCRTSLNARVLLSVGIGVVALNQTCTKKIATN